MFFYVRLIRNLEQKIGRFLPKKTQKNLRIWVHRHVVNKIKYDLQTTKMVSDNSVLLTHPQQGLEHNVVWIFWWDISNMSFLVERNIQQARKVFGKRLIVLTKQNILDYLKIDEKILNQVDRNIGIQVFSDYVRVSLLYVYGGLWMDSTVWVEKDPVNIGKIYTAKSQDKFNSKFVPSGRWSIYLLGGDSRKEVFKFVSDSLYKYLDGHLDIPDYFLTDYIFSIAYDNNIGGFRSEINQLPELNPDIEILAKFQDYKYSDHLWKDMTLNTDFFKLSNKSKPDKYKSESFYNVITSKGTNLL